MSLCYDSATFPDSPREQEKKKRIPQLFFYFLLFTLVAPSSYCLLYRPTSLKLTAYKGDTPQNTVSGERVRYSRICCIWRLPSFQIQQIRRTNGGPVEGQRPATSYSYRCSVFSVQF